ncbi:MAG: ACT domain-containing protein, partial [Acidobacteria bacterium]
LEAVGLIAAVSGKLADAGIPTNPVSAFHHDHLFVPAAQAETAVAALKSLGKTTEGSCPIHTS